MTVTEFSPAAALNVATLYRRMAGGEAYEAAYAAMWRASLKDERKPQYDSPARGPGRPASTKPKPETRRRVLSIAAPGAERDQRIRDMHHAGHDSRAIADAIGVTVDVVSTTKRRLRLRTVNAYMVARRSGAKDVARSARNRATVAAYRAEGLTQREIADLMKLSVSTVKSYCRKVAA